MLTMTLWGRLKERVPRESKVTGRGHCPASNPDVNMPWSSTTLLYALRWKYLEWVCYSSYSSSLKNSVARLLSEPPYPQSSKTEGEPPGLC